MNPKGVTLGHYFIYVYPVVIIVTGAMSMFMTGFWLFQFVYLAIISGFYLAAKHDVSLCERCIAGMPLDGDTEVARLRWRWALRTEHAITRFRSRTFIAIMIVIAASIAVVTELTNKQVSSAIFMAVIILCAVHWGATYIHARLKPWCPWCHWGGGGDGRKENPIVPVDPSGREPSPR